MQENRLNDIFAELNELLDRESQSIEWMKHQISHDRALAQFRDCEARVDVLLDQLGAVLGEPIVNRHN